MSGFVFLAALFFIARFGNFLHSAAPYVMPLPVLFLAVSMLCYHRKIGLISAALFLSSLGDMAGSADCFLAQISFFSAAHMCYIAYFLHNARFSKASLPLLSIVLSAVFMISCYIVPHTDGIERWFVIFYILAITTMGAASVFNGACCYWLYVLAASVFMMSDSIIAWNRFVETIPHATAYIMSSYYAAQLLFAVTTIRTCSK